MKGHAVTIYDARPKAGGLNEYGIAAYKAPGDFAQREVDYILGIGGIDIFDGQMLGRDFSLEDLRQKHDAVFLGMGLGGVNALGAPGDHINGVLDAVEFIAHLRSADSKADVPVGRRVVVIGGGMTAVDASVQSRLLGAREVNMVYRRGTEAMGASEDEQTWAKTNGVTIEHWLAPVAFEGENGAVRAVRFEQQQEVEGRLKGTGVFETRAADTVLLAVGQKLATAPWLQSLRLDAGRIAVDAQGRTSLAGVWAGGDCVGGGRDLTVEAVEDGKQAALAIHSTLSSSNA